MKDWGEKANPVNTGCESQDEERDVRHDEEEEPGGPPGQSSIERGDATIFQVVTKGNSEVRSVQDESGAVETVSIKGVATNFEIKQTACTKSGTVRIAALGKPIATYGLKCTKGKTKAGATFKKLVQCADVKKALMSVHSMNQAGSKVRLDGSDSYYID